MDKGILNIVQNTATETIIEIDGHIGANRWLKEGEKENSLKRIKADLNAIKGIGAKSIIVNIHSLGGNADHALSIHDALKEHPATITTKISGMCASAATIIFQAGDNRKMSNNALYLTHKCSSCLCGNENDLEAELESQRSINDRIANIYLSGGKSTLEEIKELMNANNGNGKWITAKEAEEFGFVTEVYEPGTTAKAACISQSIFAASKLPALPAGYENLLEDEKETSESFLTKIGEKIENILQSLENKFNTNTNQNQNTSMKKFPLIVALLALAEDTSFDERTGLNISNEQLEKIEARFAEITALEKEVSDLKAEATTAKETLATKEAKITELQAIVDKKPTPTNHVNGGDAKDDADTFEASMKKDPYYQEIAKENGLTL